MSEWVRTDIDYGHRWARLAVSNRQARHMGLSLPDLAEDADPKAIEAIVYDLIEELRPEWAGGTLFGIRYDLASRCWEFAYCHRAMPDVPPGALPERLPLVPGR